MFKARAILAGLALLLVLTVVSCPIQSCMKPTDTAGPRPLTAKQAYSIAKNRAQEWQDNAYLEEILIALTAKELETGPASITFRFVYEPVSGLSRSREQMDITIDTYQGKVVAAEDRGGTLDYKAADLEGAVVDSSDAIRKAEDTLGRAYRREHPDARVLISGNSQSPDHRLLWFVGYFPSSESEQVDVFICMDAKTGQVIDVRREQASP